MSATDLDQDLLVACADLVGRSGARSFEIGWLNDPGEPAYTKHGPQWYAHAQLKGARIGTEDHPGPTEACDALCTKILTGAKCKCGALVALSSAGALAFDNVTMADGTVWSIADAARAGQCRWRREGPRWIRGCE